MTLTVDDRELIARLERESRTVFPERMRDGHSYHATAHALDLAADRLQSLLSDRDKMELRVRELEAAMELCLDALNMMRGHIDMRDTGEVFWRHPITDVEREQAAIASSQAAAALRNTDNG